MSWLNMESLNRTLTAVSSIVAPLDEEDERAAFEGAEEVNDLQEISNAFSSMGTFVSSTLNSLDEILPAAPIGPHEGKDGRGNSSSAKGSSSSSSGSSDNPNKQNRYDHNSEENDSIYDLNSGRIHISSVEEINLSPEDRPSNCMYTSLEIQPPTASKDESFDTISMNSPTSTPKRHTAATSSTSTNSEISPGWDWNTPPPVTTNGISRPKVNLTSDMGKELNPAPNPVTEVKLDSTPIIQTVPGEMSDSALPQFATSPKNQEQLITPPTTLAMSSTELENSAQSKHRTHLEADIEKLRVQVKDLEAENNELSKKCAELSLASSSSTEEDKKKSAEIDKMKSYIERLETENVQVKTTLHDQIDQMQALEMKSRDELSSKDGTISSLEGDLTALQGDLETARSELEKMRLSQALTSSQGDEDVKLLRAEIDQMKQTHSDEIDVAYKEIEDLRASLEQAIDETNVATEKLYDEQYEHQQQINEIEARKNGTIDSLQAQLQDTKKEMEALTNSLGDGTDATKALGDALSQKQGEIDNMSSNLQQLKDEMMNIEEKLRDTCSKYSDASKESDELRALCQCRERSIEDLTAQLDRRQIESSESLRSKENEIERLQTQIDQLTQEVQIVNSRVSDEGNEIEALNERFAEKEKENAALQGEVGRFSSKNLELEKMYQQAQEQLQQSNNSWVGAMEDAKSQLLSVSQELEGKEELLSSLQKSSEDLKNQLHAALAASASVSNEPNEEIKSILEAETEKRMKAETENRQLHQVILQLRNARKNSTQDIEAIVAERDDLKRQCEYMKVEIDKLQANAARHEQTLVSSSSHLEEINHLQDQILEYEEARQQGMKLIDENRREIARLQKDLYDKDVLIGNVNSDNTILKEDLTNKELELEGLHSAMNGIESEKEQIQRGLKMDFDRKINELEAKHKDDIMEKDRLWEEKQKELKTKLIHNEQLLQDAIILQRKAELDLQSEKRKMQKTVETAIIQMRNTQEDVVDRALVANLLVSYFKKRRSRDVMDLIAKILQFDDDQKVACGLKVGTIGFRHAVGNIFKNIVNTAVSNPPAEVEGDNLAELWVNFLLEETKDESEFTRLDKAGHHSSSHVPSVPALALSSNDGSGSGSLSPSRGGSTDSTASDGSFTTISLKPSTPTFSRR